MRVARAVPILALLLVSLVAAPAAGQVFVDTSEQRLTLTPGEPARFNVTFTNPTDRPYFVAGTPSGNLSDATELDPPRFALAPEDTNGTLVTVLAPEGTEFSSGNLVLRWTIVDRQSGQPVEQVTRVHLTVDHPMLLFGIYENPLPPPFEDDWGMFTAELAGWFILAGVFVSILGVVMHRVVPQAETIVQDEMAAMLKAPVFYLVTVLGLNFSWRLVPHSPVIGAIDSVLDAIAIVVAGVLAYRITGAGLFYYGQNVAGKTETKVDDVLIPVLEKLSAAVIIGAAAFYTFQVLGVDLGFLVAGGLVAGLVISMAAQDTLSNFFSGIYLLIDRPFREGDDIQLESGEICRVDDVGMRSCRLYHYRNHQQIIVPNNDLATNRVVNLAYPDNYYRIVIPVGVAYDTDLEQATKLLYNVAMDNEDVQKGRNTAPRVFVKEFGDSSIELELRAYVPEPGGRNPVRTKLIKEIKQAFDEAGIEIPFPQRVVTMRAGRAGPPSIGDGAGSGQAPEQGEVAEELEGQEAEAPAGGEGGNGE